MPASEPASYAAACGASAGPASTRYWLRLLGCCLLGVVVIAPEETHRCPPRLIGQQALERLPRPFVASCLGGQRLPEGGDPGLRVEQLASSARSRPTAVSSASGPRRPRPATAPAASDPASSAIRRTCFGPSRPARRRSTRTRSGTRVLELGGKALDERVDIARIGPQRRREQVHVKRALVQCHVVSLRHRFVSCGRRWEGDPYDHSSKYDIGPTSRRQ